MVKANELRIGNWILIGASHQMQVSYHEIRYATLHPGNQNNYAPIPLTPEILIAAGFEETKNTGYWKHYKNKNGWYISEWIASEPMAGFEEQGAFFYGEDYLRVKYVHQLQNLYFALTGQELTINLQTKK